MPERIGQVEFRLLRLRAIHQPGNQLMGEHHEINVPLRMTGEAELAIQLFQGCSNPIPAQHIGVSVDACDRTTPLKFSATQNLQGCGEIIFTTDTAAVRSEQNPLGSI